MGLFDGGGSDAWNNFKEQASDYDFNDLWYDTNEALRYTNIVYRLGSNTYRNKQEYEAALIAEQEAEQAQADANTLAAIEAEQESLTDGTNADETAGATNNNILYVAVAIGVVIVLVLIFKK